MKPEWSFANGRPEVSETHTFYSTDTEQQYETNLTDNRAELEKHGWIPLPPDPRCVGHRYQYNPDKPEINDWVELSYQINSHGFRNIEMPTEKKPRSVMALGCSTTFGVGMPVGQIWPTLVGNTLRYRCYNMGIPSGSLDSAFRVLLAWLPKIRPSSVFLLEPPGVRYETHTHMFRGINHSAIHHPEPVGIRFEHEDEWQLHREKTMRAIKSVCDQFETPLYHSQHDYDDEYFTLFEEYDLARDLMHPGRKRHIYWAMKFLKMAGHEWSI